MNPPAHNATEDDDDDYNDDVSIETSVVTTIREETNADKLNKVIKASHNYTDCCLEKKVSGKCLGFCDLNSVIEGNTGQHPDDCEKEFPSVVQCMTGKIWLAP